MHRTISILVVGVCLAAALCVAAPAQAASGHPNPSLKWGVIRGNVGFCGDGGPAGILVYVEGLSFMAKVGDSGDFMLVYVPVGEYTVVAERNGTADVRVENVRVRKWRFTDLAPIAVCPDEDGDGFTLLDDCDDTNPDVFPGAPELCDDLDNDCDEDIDEDFDFFTDPLNCGACGIECAPGDTCVDGACVLECAPGLTDCDGVCVDLSADTSNCGDCGIVCAPDETCDAGVCTAPPAAS